MTRLGALLPLLLALACGGPSTPVESAEDEEVREPAALEREEVAETATADDVAAAMNGHVLDDGLITGAQPDAAALEAASESGREVIISLRQPSEPGFADEQALVEELGMRFVNVSVAGADGLSEENARLVHEAIEEAGASNVVLHCGSGNRAGAIVALDRFHFHRADYESALRAGEEAGLTGLRDAVEAYFEAQCNEPDAEAYNCAIGTRP